MNVWSLTDLGLEPHHPQILASNPEARVIVLRLPTGESLQEHQVHERAWLVVVEGEVALCANDERATATAGTLVEFARTERHSVRAVADATLLLLLTPWPGEGHPGAMALDDKATARERANAG